jgi:hypothetical protein
MKGVQVVRVSILVVVLAAVSVSVASASRLVHPTLHASPNPVKAGHVLMLKGNAKPGCTTGDTVTVMSKAFVGTHEFAGIPAVYATVKSGGAFKTTTTIPTSKKAGTYTVTGRCGGGNFGVEAHLHVTH